jgi:hypothetical protein
MLFQMVVKTVNRNEEQGPFQPNRWKTELDVEVEWEANSFVALQIVDHAVLLHNDRVHLTPRRVNSRCDFNFPDSTLTLAHCRADYSALGGPPVTPAGGVAAA